MPQKVPFHYPLLISLGIIVAISLTILGVGSVLSDDEVEVTPTTEAVSAVQPVPDDTDSVAETDVNDIEAEATPADTSADTTATDDTDDADVEATPSADSDTASDDTTTDADDTNADDTDADNSTASPEDNTQDDATSSANTDFDPALAAGGETNFIAACSACHGVDALGIENLGKPLVGSEFVQTHTNDELLTFVKTGRPIWDAENTTGIDMPPKGGNPALSDEQIITILHYIRSIDGTTTDANDTNIDDSSTNDSDADSTVSTDDIVQDDADDATSSANRDFDPVLAADGETNFIAACSACHGVDALGIENLGKPLVGSEFVQTHTYEELVTFVKTGRPIWDAENTTGIDMPPKGGNPALSDEQILTILHYIHSIDQ